MRKLALTTILAIAAACFARDPARVIPWVELNYLESQFIEPTIVGAQRWSIVSDTVCISSYGTHSRQTYELLAQRLPGMIVLPGVKANESEKSGLLKGLDDVAGWAKVAAAVADSCAVTGQKRCLLDLETVVTPYAQGQATCDPNGLAAGLRQLPTDVEYILYPAHVWGYGALDRMATYVRIVCANVPSVTLISGRYQQADWADAGAHPVRGQQVALDVATGRPIIPICYFYPRANDWPDARVVELGPLASSEAREVFVYPGYLRWPDFALGAGRALHSALQADRDCLAQQRAELQATLQLIRAIVDVSPP